MLLNIMSDLHLEFRHGFLDFSYEVEPADVLVMAGDITTNDELYRAAEWVQAVEDKFDHILIVMGNHDFYGAVGLRKAIDEFKEVVGGASSKVRVLNNESVEIGGINFVGSTLWTDFEYGCPLLMYEAVEYMSDYHCVKLEDGSRLTPTGVLAENKYSRHMIKKLHKDDKTNVLITHHSPSYEVEAGSKWHGSESSGLFHNKGFDTSPWDMLIFGHTHESVDFIGSSGERFISNQWGYPHEGSESFINYLVEIQ